MPLSEDSHTQNLVTMVANRTQDYVDTTNLSPETLETIRTNQFVIDHLMFELNRKNEIIAALVKPYQK